MRDGNVQIVVTDVSGRVVLSSTEVSSGVITVSTKEWNAGMYHIRLEQEGHIATAKFIKQ